MTTMSMMTILRRSLVGIAVPLLALGASAAFAAGTSPTPQPTQPTAGPCSQYTVGTKAYKKCIKQNPQHYSDEELYSVGYSLAKDDADYADALTVLRAMRNQNDARALTMIGYSLRKSGDVSAAFDYYQRALAIDANNVNTREYLGEAFLQKGDLSSAQGQLTEISQRCGVTCEAYVDLDQNIKTFQAKAL